MRVIECMYFSVLLGIRVIECKVTTQRKNCIKACKNAYTIVKTYLFIFIILNVLGGSKLFTSTHAFLLVVFSNLCLSIRMCLVLYA